jgi:hypothetical protein
MALGTRRTLTKGAGQCGLWLLVGLNYVQHVLLRSPPWSLSIVVCGHVLLALFALSYGGVMFTPPLEPPQQWYDAGMPGEADKRTGRSLPPRAYIFNDQIVLGFDHYCGWLGSPIGLHNRKQFVLLLFYGALLTAFAGALSAHEYSVETTDGAAGGLAPGLSWDAIMLFLSPALLIGRATSLMSLSIHAYTALIDAVVAAGLLCFAAYHTRLVLRNTTSLDASSYWDVGARNNWSQARRRPPMPTHFRRD